jgi:SpoVK/Ycf46/Vps4 family AAA+-type ATPase
MESDTNKNLLNKIEKISSWATKCGLDFMKLIDVEDDVKELSEFLAISYDQTILFACLVELSLQKTVTLEHLAKHLKSSIIRIINLIYEIEELEHKKYIQKCLKSDSKKHSYKDIGYTVPINVIESLRTVDKSKLNSTIRLPLPKFLEEITYMIGGRAENLMPTYTLLDQVEFLITMNRRHQFVQFVNDNTKLTIDKCVVYVLAYNRLKRTFALDLDSLISPIFDDFSEQMEYIQNLSVGNSELFKKDIVMFQESQFTNERVIGLSAKTIEMLYRIFPELLFQEESNEGIIKAESIKMKRLYYDEYLKKQIDSLTSVLKKKNFGEFQTRLQESSLPKGITAIFYGQSGTGKTETAYQIAKKTGRDILMVELSQLKSKWFGESEKQVKGIFDSYRRIFDNSKVKPILFINEADGIFSKRMEITGRRSSTDQTMNTIQNIILQELENFNGILFATTNLTENLDSAFERRFLFKVEFKNPVPEVREKIWKSKLPELTSTHLKNLSSKYQLSGGEIENVARKYMIEKVIERKKLSLARLMEFCELEKPFQKQNRIGFHN